MATFTQLLADLAVIQKLSDLPNQNDGLTATQLKAKFDEAPETVQDYINNTLIPELQKTTAESGASRIGVETISGLTGNDVQTVLESVKSYLDGDVSNLQAQINSNDTDISNLQTNKADVTYVNSEVANVQSQVTANDGDIADLDATKADTTYVNTQDNALQEQITSNDGDISTLQSVKADKTNVIEKNSTVAYTPTLGTHPANKNYVDTTVTEVAVGNLPEDSVTNAYLDADVKVGSLAALTTDDKSSVTAAVNEVDGKITNSYHFDPVDAYGNVKTIDDFQSLTNKTALNGTLFLDSTNVKIGSNSVKVTATNPNPILRFENQSLNLETFNNGGASSDDDFIYSVVYLSTLSDVTRLDFNFDISSTVTGANTFKFEIPVSQLISGFNYIPLKKSDAVAVGSPSWDNIQSIQIQLRTSVNSSQSFSAQLLQLVKADASGAYPNPFGDEWTINSGEWFVGEEFGKVILKEMAGGAYIINGIKNNKLFSNFIINTEITPLQSSIYARPTGWYVDSSNYIVSRIQNSVLEIDSRKDGVAYTSSTPFTIEQDALVNFTLKKENGFITLTAYKNNDLSTSKTVKIEDNFDANTKGTLILGRTNTGMQNFDKVSITEIPHAYHADIAEVAKGLTEQAYLRVSKSTAQSIPNNTITDVTFDNIEIDNRNSFDGTRYTIPETGIYNILAQFRYTSNANGERFGYIRKDSGAVDIAQITLLPTTSTFVFQASSTRRFNQGDTVLLRTLQTSGASLDILSGSLSYMEITKIG